MAETTASVLDAEPAAKVPEAEPMDAVLPEEPAADEMTEKAPRGDDIGSKLDRILAMLEAKSRGGRGEHPLHDETDLDEMIARLSGEGEKKSLTIPVEESCDALDGPAKDAALQLLRKVRPAVAAIQDKAQRARVTDALLSAVQGQDHMDAIAKAAADSARAAAKQTNKTDYEQLCADSEAGYAARNPHRKKEER